MGAMKRLTEAKREKTGTRKGSGSGSGMLARLNHTDGPSDGGGASWDDVPDSLIAWLVRKVSNEGGLVTLARTRDGGALKVSIWDSGDKHDEYFGSQADMGMAVWSFCLRLCADDEVGPGEP